MADWLPGTFEKTVMLKRVGPIEAYARAAGLSDRVPPDGVAVPRFAEPVSGVVLVSAVEAGGGPVVTRRAHGLGTVTWLGLDLDAEPLRGWSGSETLLAAALGGRSRGGLDRRPAEQGACRISRGSCTPRSTPFRQAAVPPICRQTVGGRRTRRPGSPSPSR